MSTCLEILCHISVKTKKTILRSLYVMQTPEHRLHNITGTIVLIPGHPTLVYGCKAPEGSTQLFAANWFRYPTSGCNVAWGSY